MNDIDVPPFFICPISLEIMKDPVTVSTGITYDRDSIEKWLFSGKNTTCPVTKLVISDCELTPNHTLRRLIQSWCMLNASHGIERIPTPKPPISKAQIIKLLNDAKSPQQQINCLKSLQSIASENATNKRCIESSGAVELLASIVSNHDYSAAEGSLHYEFESIRSTDVALSILYNLQLSEASLRNLLFKNGDFIVSLTRVMQRGRYDSRAYAVLLLNSMVEVADARQLTNLRPELFIELNGVLHDQISKKATKASLQLLAGICPWGRNRIKAAEAGVVSVLIDLLLDSSLERRACEMILTVLDAVCGCAEGRSELLQHGAGVAIVSKKILRVSQVASERAVRILLSISKFCGTTMVLQEMLILGVVAKLCLVLQMDCGFKTKEKAREVLKLHARVWKNSPCVPTTLLSHYPA
ncbi:E3 ubiquitin-protein ligase PUB22 [Hibiscus syriacus]|uniref:U-box domain-containing protein n=1 Tax=Hibiscus syriacus TaxID=106335 RepID=A0A6A3CEB1_HIBSY|nr:E3 ubiquitin-protein ligase PUB23-like [Hibiscus syriacus]KAE8725768.1 E3 ubiquitin-protein ligase PUB22 [Hibiscus syriacus]